ncbi:MAG: hypothetical protein IJ220_03385 [Clostridia bacterium]|nr:hypothetical protein [Clostridia bacterium]
MSQKKVRNNGNSAKKVSEVMFMGNSAELKQFISKKMKALNSLKVATKNGEVENKVCGLIYVCESVLELPYFKRGKVRSMPELIEATKQERQELQDLMESIKPDLESAKAEALEAFKAVGSYLANKYEDSYNSLEQIHARECIDEYQALQAEYEKAEEDAKTNWWLLGIIHRPTGFFAKVDETLE